MVGALRYRSVPQEMFYRGARRCGADAHARQRDRGLREKPSSALSPVGRSCRAKGRAALCGCYNRAVTARTLTVESVPGRMRLDVVVAAEVRAAFLRPHGARL